MMNDSAGSADSHQPLQRLNQILRVVAYSILEADFHLCILVMFSGEFPQGEEPSRARAAGGSIKPRASPRALGTTRTRESHKAR